MKKEMTTGSSSKSDMTELMQMAMKKGLLLLIGMTISRRLRVGRDRKVPVEL